MTDQRVYDALFDDPLGPEDEAEEERVICALCHREVVRRDAAIRLDGEPICNWCARPIEPSDMGE